MLVVNTQHAKIKCSNLGSHATIVLYCNIVEILKTKTYFHFISLIWHWKSREKVCKSDRALAFECCLVFLFYGTHWLYTHSRFSNPIKLISRTGDHMIEYCWETYSSHCFFHNHNHRHGPKKFKKIILVGDIFTN